MDPAGRRGAGDLYTRCARSGAGKSTVLSLLRRLYDVDAGAITLDGVDLRYCLQRTLRERTALVPQDSWLLVTHDRDLAAIADRVVTSSRGTEVNSMRIQSPVAHRGRSRSRSRSRSRD